MTTLAQAKQAILSTVATWAAALSPAMPLEFPGESFAQPTDGSRYARVVILTPGDEQISLGKVGTRNHRNTGTATVEISVPGGDAGTAALDTLLAAARNLFRDTTISGVHFGAVPMGPIFPRGGHLVGSVIAPFVFYDTV